MSTIEWTNQFRIHWFTMVATLFISSNILYIDLQIVTSVKSEVADHSGGKREKKNIQGGEEWEGGGIHFYGASLELQPSIGVL